MSEEAYRRVVKDIFDKHIKFPRRMKQEKRTAYIRAKIIDLLYKTGRPMSMDEIAFELGLSHQTVALHLAALVTGKVVCYMPSVDEPKLMLFTICPRCPMKDACTAKNETVWRETP